jgi:hypothetical protein
MSKAGDAKTANHAIAKTARNVIAKSIVDISELNIACSGGTVELYGKLRPPRSHPGAINMKQELEHIKDMVLSVRGVREVNSNRVIVIID